MDNLRITRLVGLGEMNRFATPNLEIKAR